MEVMEPSVSIPESREPSDSLAESDIALLECEREFWGPGPQKEDVVFRRFGLGLPAYYQRLYQVCETPAAIRYDAVLVRQIHESADHVTRQRLRRVRGQQGGSRG